MKLHQRINVSDYVDEEAMQIAEKSVKDDENPTSYLLDKIVFSWKSWSGHNRYLLAIKQYLLEDHQRAAEQWRLVARDIEEYFFGDWRRTFKNEKTAGNPDYWKQCEWMRLYEIGLVACSVSGQWNFARRLSEYPDERCGQDIDSKPEERSLMLALAEWLRAGQLSATGDRQLGMAAVGKSVRAKEESKLLRAALGNNPVECDKALADYMKFYSNKIFPLNDVTEKQSKLGTFFFHWWTKSGIALFSAEQSRDYIICLPQVNLGTKAYDTAGRE